MRAAAPVVPVAPAHGVMLAVFGLLVLALLAMALWLSAPQTLGALGFVNGSFGVTGRADFDTNPPGRFAPQRAVVTTEGSRPAG